MKSSKVIFFKYADGSVSERWYFDLGPNIPTPWYTAEQFVSKFNFRQLYHACLVYICMDEPSDEMSKALQEPKEGCPMEREANPPVLVYNKPLYPANQYGIPPRPCFNFVDSQHFGFFPHEHDRSWETPIDTYNKGCGVEKEVYKHFRGVYGNVAEMHVKKVKKYRSVCFDDPYVGEAF